MKFTSLVAVVATASAVKITDDFNYDSTGGHPSVNRLPTAAPSLNPIVRGTDDTGNRSNADNNGTPVIEKVL